jgi:hypothetical protein
MSEERPQHPQEPAEGAEEAEESPGVERAGDKKGCHRRITNRGLSSIRRSLPRGVKRLRKSLEPSELKAAPSSSCSLPRSDKIRPQARPYIRQVLLAGRREHAPRNAGGIGPGVGFALELRL